MLALLPVSARGAVDGPEPRPLWAALLDGRHVALMRHATAPGIGDPSNFRVDDCRTQRNLSEEGRSQALAIGERFRAHGITRAAVYSSQWCRCLDTARLLGLGDVTPFAGLNSFFRDRGREAASTAAVRALIAREVRPGRPLVLVTHQVNITALSGVHPASGEIVVLRVDGDEWQVAGRLAGEGGE
ncbi:MAG: histidine phosphatase family protein [Betaproteobacteria bacterium]|nr:MAG: histidine phosphatase family protein [Betaproteobacteria bacterium]